MKAYYTDYYTDNDEGTSSAFFKVFFKVKRNGVDLVRYFESPYLAKQFADKVKRGKSCVLIGTEGF